MLEHIISNDATPNDFATRHGWEPYLCRYRDCPRAIQGFNSSVLRQEHENSHAPRFRCNHVACEVLGSDLASRTALNKHNKKYHDGNSLAAIPTSLRKASVRPQHDRPRFLLKESSSHSRKRSFHVVEEDKVRGESVGVMNNVYNIQKSRLSKNEDKNNWNVRCICGYKDDEKATVKCDLCHTAQHVLCYYMDKHGTISRFGEHLCLDCQPRPIDVELAIFRQGEQRSQDSEYLRAVKLAEGPQGLVKSGSWSLDERAIFRVFVRQHGTNWENIARDMRSRRWDEVYKF